MPAADDAAAANGSSAALLERLRCDYPQTVAAFEAMGAAEHLERVWWLERNWERILRGEYSSAVYEQRPAAEAPPTLDYDLIYAGGGLGLIHAAVMAHCHGRRVLLFDRSEVGCVHREWNISRGELQALVSIGLVTWEELAPVIMREYRAGVVDFYTGPYCKVPHSNLWFADVLNVAIDAGGLLRLMRRKFEQAGGTILDRRAFCCVRALESSAATGRARNVPTVEVLLEAMESRQQERYTARLLLDGMGSTSPLALLRHAGEPFAGVCPTVGTVVSGLVPGTARNEFDPTIGDILISVDDTQDDKQMIWEGFPGRGDELTVYVFYYAALKRAGSRTLDPHRTRSPGGSARPAGEPRYSLLALFEQYFAMLPSYKKPGPDFAHIKPVYGYIPGRHSLHAQEAPLLRGVLSVGDSAAQQSPLTYCGFGSHVRNLHRTTSLLEYALQHEVLEPEHMRHITAFQTNVSLNWVFSRFMQAWGRPHNVNQLQNAFLGALNELDGDLAARFFRDRMRWHDYNQVVWYTMRRYPDVFLIAWPVLGVSGVWQWFRDYLAFSASATYAAAGRKLGTRGERWLQALAERIDPALGLQVRARYAEWRAMDWL
jgi:lycopene cyclase CruA